MSNETDDLKKQWNVAKMAMPITNTSASKLAQLAAKRKKEIIWFQYGNAIALSVLVVILVLFLIYLFPFRETLSHAGVVLMIGGVVVRVIIELMSVFRSKKIHLLDDSVSNLDSTIAYYQFRKRIHGPVTYSIVALYVIGFFMLMPEFLKYIDWRWMLLFGVLGSLSGIFIAWQIRKAIKKEMESLKEVVKMREDIVRS